MSQYLFATVLLLLQALPGSHAFATDEPFAYESALTESYESLLRGLSSIGTGTSGSTASQSGSKGASEYLRDASALVEDLATPAVGVEPKAVRLFAA